MFAPKFKDGPWVGFYSYLNSGQRHLMDLRLRFHAGNIEGDGADAINHFVISGTYDSRKMECTWKKIYPKVTVEYQGQAEGNRIRGYWTVNKSQGGFQIWPLADGLPTDQNQLEKELPSRRPYTAPLIVLP